MKPYPLLNQAPRHETVSIS